MFYRMALFLGLALPVCLWAGFWEGNEGGSYGVLTEEEMRGLVGGHGGSGCDSCQEVDERLDECAHFTTTDACKTNQCIENWLIEDSCQVAVQSNCWAVIDTTLDCVVQKLRVDTNCTTNNPTQWQIWRIHYYGSTCKTRTHQVRCQKPTNNCTGTLISESSRSPAIKCI